MQLLPLGLIDEQLTGLGALEGADNAPFLHLIHQTGGTGIAQLQAALEHGDGGLSRFQNHLHGGGQQLVAILLRLGGFGRGLSSAALFLLLHRLLNFVHDLTGVLRLAGGFDEAHYPLDLLRGDEAALHTGGLPGPQRGIEHIALAHQLFCAGGIQNDAGLQ